MLSREEARALEASFWNVLRNGLQAPRMQRPVLPRLKWEFCRSQTEEDMWFLEADRLHMSGEALARWLGQNPRKEDACNYLATATSKAGTRAQVAHESEDEYAGGAAKSTLPSHRVQGKRRTRGGQGLETELSQSSGARPRG